MTQESFTVRHGEKTSRIIESISDRYKVSLEKATDIYYNSLTSMIIEEGVADLYCRS